MRDGVRVLNTDMKEIRDRLPKGDRPQVNGPVSERDEAADLHEDERAADEAIKSVQVFGAHPNLRRASHT